MDTTRPLRKPAALGVLAGTVLAVSAAPAGARVDAGTLTIDLGTDE